MIVVFLHKYKVSLLFVQNFFENQVFWKIETEVNLVFRFESSESHQTT